jgi:hypothetical protein
MYGTINIKKMYELLVLDPEDVRGISLGAILVSDCGTKWARLKV